MDNREDQIIWSGQMMVRLALAGILVVLAAPAAAAAADAPLGRLFFTPSQRASLDVARKQRTRATVATERTEEDVQPVPQTVTYGGMVRRSDGRTTVWLNDRAINDAKAGSGPTIIRQVRPDGAVTLEMPQSSRRVDLKVGQSVEVLSGSVSEQYRRQTPAPDPEQKPAATAPGTLSTQSAGGAEKPPQGESTAPEAREAPATAGTSAQGTTAVPSTRRSN
jgi:hypothetical protein